MILGLFATKEKPWRRGAPGLKRSSRETPLNTSCRLVDDHIVESAGFGATQVYLSSSLFSVCPAARRFLTPRIARHPKRVSRPTDPQLFVEKVLILVEATHRKPPSNSPSSGRSAFSSPSARKKVWASSTPGSGERKPMHEV